jgi:Spy/CpxP family protein refolding chaperone
MNFLQQKRILLWVIAVLLVFNISAGITILFHIFGGNPTETETGQTDYLQTELNLSNEQVQGLGMIKAQFKQSSQPVASSIMEVRSKIVDELANNQPDTIKIRGLADELGVLQGELTYKIASQYVDIRDLCDPQQAQKLNNTYKYLFGVDDSALDRGRQYKHRHGRQGNKVE